MTRSNKTKLEQEDVEHVAPTATITPLTRDARVRREIAKFTLAHQHLTPEVYQFKLSRILAKVELSDAGNALRFHARYGNQFCYVKETGQWLQWNGRIWKADNAFSIMHYALRTTAYIDMEAEIIPPPTDEQGHLLMKPQLSAIDTPTADQAAILKKFDAHDKHVESLHKWARSSRSRRAAEAMIELLKAEPGITRVKAEFDADNMLINCQNGILDLKTMAVRPHDKNALCTLITNVNAVPDALCPLWDAFTHKVMKQRPALVRYLRQLAGMGLTGERYEDIFPVFHGSGENGKTVFQEVLREIFGSYCDVATSGMFLERKNDNGRFEAAELDGVRLLFKDETKQGSMLDEGTVKAMTGGGALKGEKKFHDIFTFMPKFTPILSTNHKPRIAGNDDGIWRRVKLVPWEHSFKNDPEKKSKPDVFAELRTEHEGIFMWAVMGLQALLNDGYCEPDEVKVSTQEYRSASDIMGAFIQEKCITGNDKNCWVTIQALYDAYRDYMEKESGSKAFGKGNFGEQFVERGFMKDRTTKRGWYWQGIRLRGENEEYQAPESEPQPPVSEFITYMHSFLETGCTIRIRKDGSFGIGVPDAITDEQFTDMEVYFMLHDTEAREFIASAKGQSQDD